ncbi:hypothetical protein V1478_008936 [Vespula squamosa]|uniref:Uncharacterized protein n=1 Tax=Vespula squamosa TaxID=30214 RepID=A0ABD2AUZ4_VESSQ
MLPTPTPTPTPTPSCMGSVLPPCGITVTANDNAAVPATKFEVKVAKSKSKREGNRKGKTERKTETRTKRKGERKKRKEVLDEAEEQNKMERGTVERYVPSYCFYELIVLYHHHRRRHHHQLQNITHINAARVSILRSLSPKYNTFTQRPWGFSTHRRTLCSTLRSLQYLDETLMKFVWIWKIDYYSTSKTKKKKRKQALIPFNVANYPRMILDDGGMATGGIEEEEEEEEGEEEEEEEEEE